MKNKSIQKKDFCINLTSRCLKKDEEEFITGETCDPALDETPCEGGPKLMTRKKLDPKNPYKESRDKTLLSKVYLCSLTNEPCVARIMDKLRYVDGYCNEVEVSLFYQRRCPAFEDNLEERTYKSQTNIGRK